MTTPNQPLVHVAAHPVHRLTIQVEQSVRDFRARYEAAVPPYPASDVTAMVTRGASWEEMLAVIGRAAPLGFLVYGTTEPDPVMRLAGDEGSCVAYLMGNHTIAERMFRHEPLAMLYAPLRTAIWAYADGSAKFSLDRPSDLFASFGNAEITAVGLELDHKVATLLEHLDVPVPDLLRAR